MQPLLAWYRELRVGRSQLFPVPPGLIRRHGCTEQLRSVPRGPFQQHRWRNVAVQLHCLPAGFLQSRGRSNFFWLHRVRPGDKLKRSRRDRRQRLRALRDRQVRFFAAHDCLPRLSLWVVGFRWRSFVHPLRLRCVAPSFWSLNGLALPCALHAFALDAHERPPALPPPTPNHHPLSQARTFLSRGPTALVRLTACRAPPAQRPALLARHLRPSASRCPLPALRGFSSSPQRCLRKWTPAGQPPHPPSACR